MTVSSTSKKEAICYYCDEPATSDEHVPPKALFPKPKDSPGGKEYRRNLLTVPSCDVHNTAKSKDDEYLLYVLALCWPSNEVGQNQFLTKVQRAAKRKPALLNALTLEYQHVRIHDTEKDTWEQSIAIRPDEKRLLDQFTHISKAIYFLETGQHWPGSVSVLIEFLLSLDDVERNARLEGVVRVTEEYLVNVSHKGDNKEVFSYQFVENDGRAMLRLHFYGDNKVSAVFLQCVS